MKHGVDSKESVGQNRANAHVLSNAVIFRSRVLCIIRQSKSTS